MKAEKLINELEYTRKKYEGKPVSTFETNIVAMFDDCISTVKELMPLATIGKATEKAFELYIMVDASTFDIKTVAGDSNELLAWYAEQEQDGMKE